MLLSFCGCHVVMHRKRKERLKRFLLLVVCLMTTFLAVAQKEGDSDTVRFRLKYAINSPELDASFTDNASRMTNIREFLREVRDDKLVKITDVKFRGTASPDGTYEFNVWLSENRLRNFKQMVHSYINIPDSIIHANTTAIPWDEFRASVAASAMDYRDEILAIIDEEPSLVPFYNNRHLDARLLKLKALHGGKAWEALKSPILRDLRYGDAVFAFVRILPEGVALTVDSAEMAFTPPTILLQPLPEPEPTVDVWLPRFHVKTNLIALAMLSANLGLEIDMARHWSFTLPVSYCAIDWFKSTIKFRNFTVQPEIRYWFRHADNDGFFVGPHFQLCYYNYAFDGLYRYQDYRGRTPALGGGLGFGYRKPISKNRRWRMELELGAGVYPLDYSVFHNTPDVKDGQWIERRKKTYWGLDNAAVTLGYSFDLKKLQRTSIKKGGAR